MKDSNSLFYSKGQLYDDFRPEYPISLIDDVESFFNIDIAGNIAEFGCGTGKFTKILFNTKISQLTVVEPDEEMLSYLRQEKSYFPSLSVVSGTAENSKIKSKSIDIIFSAQAFHHFDPLLCVPEFQRILKSDGKIILLWYFSNMESLLSREIRESFYHFGKRQVQKERLEISNKSIESLFSMHTVKSGEVGSIAQNLTYENFIGSMCSSSYAPRKNNTLYKEYVKSFEKIYKKHEKQDSVLCEFNIMCYCISL